MKTFITRTLGLAAALALATFAGHARAQDAITTNAGDSSVSFQTFYDQLAGQGTWIQSSTYGNVWQPTENDPNWRPYTYGHWVNTEAGMTWVSDESFGWATDHYGRWVNLNGTGWVWVPGYTWAPAWVSWRDGGDEVGWAPLPPDSDQGIDYYDDDDYFTDTGFGFHIGDDCDTAYGIGPLWYNFCPVAFIGDRDCWRHFQDRRDNFALIGRTRNVTNINFRHDAAGRFGQVTAEGPSVAALNARSRTPIETARLTSASQRGDAGLRGNSLAVYAPRVDPATFHTARPAAIDRNVANAGVNRGTDINRPLAVNSRVQPAVATSEQVRAATAAQRDVPANARVATANTRISRPLTHPLSALRTTTRSNDLGAATRSSSAFRSDRVGTPAAAAESRFTGERTAPHGTLSSSGESAFTGEAVRSPAVSSAMPDSRFNGEGFRSQVPSRESSLFRGSPSYPSSVSGDHSADTFHSSAPAFQSTVPAYHPQANFERSASMFHTSSPAYHSFAPAPQPHFGGGQHFGGGSPAAAHVSGGNFGGGGRSGGGGGAVHASAAAAGGGHAGGRH